MRRSRYLLVTKGIIAILLISSMQIMTVQANSASLFLPDSTQPCSMLSMHASGDEHKENSGSNSPQTDHSCSHCNSIASHCHNNCNVGSSAAMPMNIRMDLKINDTIAFYTRITFPPTLLQQPKLRPPRL